LRFFVPTPPLAEYRLDECSGTTATDASGNGYNGTLAGGITVASGGRICTSDTLNGSTGYIGLPASFPNLGSAVGYTSFTIASWFNSTDAAKSGQRIYVDDQNNTGGFAISLGDGGTGMVRFFSRAVNPVIFDSPAVVTSNNWYFLVATHDATLKKRRLMIYSAGGSLLSDTNQTYTGPWGSDAGTVAIGGENLASTENSSNFRFQGRLDETRIYSRVLADTEIAAIYANEVQGLHRDGSLRLCPVCNATLGNFNAFDTSMAAGTVAGVIRSKIAGTTLAASSGNIDVVSLSGGALSASSGNTTVQFLDAHDNSGAMDAKGCRSTWTLSRGSFTYMSQTNLGVSMAVAAKSAQNITSTRYGNANCPTAGSCTLALTAWNGASQLDITRLTPLASFPTSTAASGSGTTSSYRPAQATTWTSGAYTVSGAAFAFARNTTTPDGPLTLSLQAAITDPDSVAIAGSNAIGPTPIRFGVIKLDSAYGSELLPLRVPVRAMYWTGTTWPTNTLDSCTTIPAGTIAIGNVKPPASPLAPTATLPVTLSNGASTLVLTQGATKYVASADIALNLTGTTTDVSCNTTHPTPTAGANLPWLQGKWGGSTACPSTLYDRDPNARITFGSPKAPYIYLRERY
jgi:hypothetical protein